MTTLSETIRCQETPDMYGKTDQEYAAEKIQHLTQDDILKQDVQRILTLEAERASISEEIKAIYDRLKQNHQITPKTLRQVIKLYDMPSQERVEQELEREAIKCALKLD